MEHPENNEEYKGLVVNKGIDAFARSNTPDFKLASV